MNDEQIIIDGVDIFDTLDNWADLISQEWCSGEYPVAEIIKNYILDINKKLARKTQECEQKDERIIELTKEALSLKQECEGRKEQISYLTKFRKQTQTCQECYEDGYNVGVGENKELARYRKALEEIEDICNVADRYELEELQETIFNIINKAKGEE